MASSSSDQQDRTSNSPVHKIRVAGITATIWENEAENGRTFYNTTMIRSYKDATDAYVETNSYLESQLLELSAAAQMAHAWIVQRHAEDRAKRRDF